MKIIVAALVAVAMAAPAFADSQISGYFRNQFIADNIGQIGNETARTQSQIDQRLRVRYQNNLNEYVHFVYYAEVDTLWGQASKGAIGGGGQAGADGVNVETKNVYLDFKIPNSIFSFRTGIQGVGDRWENALIGDDWAGVQANIQFIPMFNSTVGYFKAYENNTTLWDDVDLYFLQNNLKVSDNIKVGLDFYYLDSNNLDLDDAGAATGLFGNIINNAGANTTPALADIYWVGANAGAKVGPVALDGFLVYNFGTIEAEAAGIPDIDIAAFMASARAKMDIGPAKTGLRLTYYSSDDDDLDDEINTFVGNIGGVYEFPAENLSIFFADKFYNNTNGGRRALIDAAYQGFGLFAINATADFKLPANLYLNTGLGYFMALEDTFNNVQVVEDTDLGLEIAARIGTKVAEKVDVSLGGAYAMLGDFYNPAPGVDADDIYKVNFMVNVGF